MTGGILLAGLLAVLHADAVLAFLCKLLHAVRPLLLGVLFAAILNPAYERLYAEFTRFAQKHRRSPQAGWIRAASLTGAVLPPLLVPASAVCILLPQLTESVRMLAGNFRFYTANLTLLLERYSRTPLAALIPAGRVEALIGSLPERIPALLVRTYTCTAAALDVLLDIGIGLIFSLYLLADKQRLREQLRRLCGERFGTGRMKRLARRGRLTCETFARFLSSQCKEAMILGVMCWACMRLFGMPYPVLISAVIGVTNIVPYVGPLAGTVPCALLVLLVRPQAVIGFLVLILVLQQIESNLIYPRIVGNSVGLPPAWVLAAIVTGGGLFGAAGMLLAVPAAAVVYTVLFPAEATDSA